MDIENSVFLITGAGSGLGAGTARLFAETGAKIIVVDINESFGFAATLPVLTSNCRGRFPMRIGKDC